MFGILKNWLNTIQENQNRKDICDYYKQIDDAFDNGKWYLNGNFSYAGYKHIFEKLIEQSKLSVYVFCENYDKIFTEELFLLFKLKVKHGLIVHFFTCEDHENFKELKNYENFKYHLLKKKNEEVKVQNFIVSDEKHCWLEDPDIGRIGQFDFFKACIRLNDYITSAKLIDFCERLLKNE